MDHVTFVRLRTLYPSTVVTLELLLNWNYYYPGTIINPHTGYIFAACLLTLNSILQPKLSYIYVAMHLDILWTIVLNLVSGEKY